MRETYQDEDTEPKAELQDSLRTMAASPEGPGLPSSPLEEITFDDSKIPDLEVLPAEVREYQDQVQAFEEEAAQELPETSRDRERVVRELAQIQRDVRMVRHRLGERDYDGQKACLDVLEQVGQLIDHFDRTAQSPELERQFIESHLAYLQRLLYALPYSNESHHDLEVALSDQLFPALRQYLEMQKL